MNPRIVYPGGFLFAAIFLLNSEALSQPVVDFGFAPQRYFTAICYPQDWQKTLVNENGSLLYDFGPGPYASALTEISIRSKEDTLRVVHQTLKNGSVPVVSTRITSRNSSMQLLSFSLLPMKQSAPHQAKQVVRMGGMNGCTDWTRADSSLDPAFRNVAWGTNRAIRYRVKVDRGSRKKVALGFCESYKPRAGTRLIELRVEGAETVTVDPMPDGVKNRPSVVVVNARDADRDGWLKIEAHASVRSPDPNVILNAFWIFPESARISPETIISGSLSRDAEVYHSCGLEAVENAPSIRMDAMIATFDGNTTPIVSIRSRRSLTFDASAGALSYKGKPFILVRPKPLSSSTHDGVTELEMPKGSRKVEVVAVNGVTTSGFPFPDLEKELKRAQEFWRKQPSIPRRPFVVPDSGIQFLIDASVRNMYQIAEVVDDAFQFQPGPTVYRGLWLADVVFTGESALLIADAPSTRRFLEGALKYQLPSGQMRVMEPTQSLLETPAYVYALCRYALCTSDSAWLRRHWSVIEKGITWIESVRSKAQGEAYYGLMPPGFVDGGISTLHADYGTTFWAMIALEKGIASARWLGKTREAAAWKILLNHFMQSFEQSARRDIHPDRNGRSYLPVIVGDTTTEVPQRGQYAFLLPLQYGKFFSQNSFPDSLAQQNLAMLDSYTKEGLIVNSGWMNEGVWPWLAGIYGIAYQLRGNKQKANEILYAFANHAAPTGVWVEEQQQQAIGGNTSGDGSNAETSAIFLQFVRRLLLEEKGDDLEFLSGVPVEWIHRGAALKVNNGLTECGTVSLSLQISKDGKRGELFVSAIDGRGKKGCPVVVMTSLKRAGFVSAKGTPLPEKLVGSWKKPMRLSIVSTH